MPKYYTPKAAIRFANLNQAAFKSFAQRVEQTIQCVSDHSLQSVFYSGVLKFRVDDWKRYTVVYLCGPSLTSLEFDLYPENIWITEPPSGHVGTLLGSNFVSGTEVYLSGNIGPITPTDFSGVLGWKVESTFVDENHITFTPPPWADEESGVRVLVRRPDFRTNQANILTFEFPPAISSVNPGSVYINGMSKISITGTYLKDFSSVYFGSGAFTASSNNMTYGDNALVGTFSAKVPTTGTYDLWVKSPSGLTSNKLPVTVMYRAPRIDSVTPNICSVNGGIEAVISGAYFLPGCQVYVDTTSSTVLSSGTSDYENTWIRFTVPTDHPAAVVKVTATNPQDGQSSNFVDFEYSVLKPIINDAFFNQSPRVVTGSSGSVLLITGSNFFSTVETSMVVEKVLFFSGSNVPIEGRISGSPTPTLVSATLPSMDEGVYGVILSSSAGTGSLKDAFMYTEAPAIASLSPDSGSSQGGGPKIVVSGQSFFSGVAGRDTVIQINGVDALDQEWLNGFSMRVTLPAQVPSTGGFVNVTAINGGTVSSAPLVDGFEYIPVPIVSYASPNKVSVAGGQVSIIGSNFMKDEPAGLVAPNNVRLAPQRDGTRIIVKGVEYITSWYTTQQVSIVLPATSAAGFVDVTASNRPLGPLVAGSRSYMTQGSKANVIEYVSIPTVTNVDPAASVLAGAAVIGVTGTNFYSGANNSVVYLSNSTEVFPCTTTYVDSTHLRFAAPAKSVATTYKLFVRNKDTTSGTWSGDFTYVDAPQVYSVSPTFGRNAGGWTLDVNGIGFLPTSNMYFSSTAWPGGFFPNNTNQTYYAYTSMSHPSLTKIQLNTPVAKTTAYGDVYVQVETAGVLSNKTVSFRMEVPPVLSSISPPSAYVGQSLTVTLNGSGFITGYTRVYQNGVDMGIANVTSPTTISYTFSSPTPGNSYNISVANGNVASGIQTFSYYSTPPISITSISPVRGLETGYSAAVYGQSMQLVNRVTLWRGTEQNISFSYVSDTQLNVTIPASYFAIYDPAATIQSWNEIHPAIRVGDWDVNDGWLQGSISNIEYVPYPNIHDITDGVDPITDPIIGTRIYIDGSSFYTNGNTAVYFNDGVHGDIPADDSHPSAYNLWYCTIPAGLNAGAVTLKMVNYGIATTTYAITVRSPSVTPSISSIDKASVQATVPTTVNVYGSNFLAGGRSQVRLTDNLGNSWSPTTTYIDAGHLSFVSPTSPNSNGTVTVSVQNDGYLTSNSVSYSRVAVSTLALSLNAQMVNGLIGSYSARTVYTSYSTLTISGGVSPYTVSISKIIDTPGYFTFSAPPAPTFLTTNSYRDRFSAYLDIGESASGTFRWSVTDNVGTNSTIDVTAYAEVYEIGTEPSCVVPGTKILMSDMTLKNAEDVVIGDQVLTEPDSSELGFGDLTIATVSNVGVAQNDTVIVKLSDERTLRCSYNHRLATSNGWVEARNLLPGTTIFGINPGVVAEVTSGSFEDVIKITVDKANTYISDGLLSHNLKIATL